MKVLFLSPWFRTLAVGWADGLRRRGHDVRVVTTAQHFDPPAVGPEDIVFRHRWREAGGVVEAARAFQDLRTWRADVVVADPVSDPRYLALSLTGRVQAFTTHDARPHDEAHRLPVLRRVNGYLLDRRADAEIVFSNYVASALPPRSHPVKIVPLQSEMIEGDVPPFVPASGRKDFIVVGRMSPYKNIPVIIEAYKRHRVSPDFRGDRLVVIGGGDPGCSIPGYVQRVDGRFKFADIAPIVASAKASLCMYSAGSQSGVQVWAMQCGTASIVSDVGALGEYLPQGEGVVPRSSPDALAKRMAELADPLEAQERGRVARAEYERRFHPDVVSRVWERVLQDLIREVQ